MRRDFKGSKELICDWEKNELGQAGAVWGFQQVRHWEGGRLYRQTSQLVRVGPQTGLLRWWELDRERIVSIACDAVSMMLKWGHGDWIQRGSCTRCARGGRPHDETSWATLFFQGSFLHTSSNPKMEKLEIDCDSTRLPLKVRGQEASFLDLSL